MSELKTLSKKDPEFKSYLLGTFSPHQRALPVRSLNINSESESVTFEVVSKDSIQRPNFFVFLLQLLKIHHLFLVLFPIFLILSKSFVDNVNFDPILALLNIFALVFIQISAHLRNDYQDHLSGFDRVHPSSGSRAIQKGWITARQVNSLSWMFLFIGLCLGAASVYRHQELVTLVGAVGLLGLFGMTAQSMGLRYRVWTELVVFFLLGPFLTVGFQISVGTGLDMETIFIGIMTGWFASYILHLRNFEFIMVNTQAKLMNSVNRLGFERSKRFLALWWLTLLLGVDVYHYIYGAFTWIWVFSVVSVFLTVPLFRALWLLKSPAGSQLKTAVDRARRSAYLLAALWILEYFMYILVIEFSP